MPYTLSLLVIPLGAPVEDVQVEVWGGIRGIDPNDRLVLREERVADALAPLDTDVVLERVDALPQLPYSTLGIKVRRPGFDGPLFRSGHLSRLPPLGKVPTVEVIEAPWQVVTTAQIEDAMARGIASLGGATLPAGSPVPPPPWALPPQPGVAMTVTGASATITGGTIRLDVTGTATPSGGIPVGWTWSGDLVLRPVDEMVEAAGSSGSQRQPIVRAVITTRSISTGTPPWDAALDLLIRPRLDASLSSTVTRAAEAAALSAVTTTVGQGVTAIPALVSLCLERAFVGAHPGGEQDRPVGLWLLAAIGSVGSLRSALGLPAPPSSRTGCAPALALTVGLAAAAAVWSRGR